MATERERERDTSALAPVAVAAAQSICMMTSISPGYAQWVFSESSASLQSLAVHSPVPGLRCIPFLLKRALGLPFSVQHWLQSIQGISKPQISLNAPHDPGCDV